MTTSGGFLKRLFSNKIAAIAACVLSAYVAAGVCEEAYVIACRASGTTPVYGRGDIKERYEPPSAKHWMGTDYAGKDVFWKALFGIRTALKVGLVGAALASVIGLALGVVAGYLGGKTDKVVVWIYSVFASIPTLLFILAFALLLRRGFLSPALKKGFEAISETLGTDPGMMALYLGIGMTGWVSLCKVARGETARLKDTAYIQAAKTVGVPPLAVVIKHLLPNLLHIAVVYFSIRFAYAVMTEVIVSYLGLGVQLEPSWGVMIAHGQQRLWRGVWWEVGAATAFMFFLVLSLHIIGDALRDALDPKLKR